jgi:hypothetical protein
VPLAFDDAALARLIRAAKGVDQSKRSRWLQRIARQFERPVSQTKGARAVRAHRERVRCGIRMVQIPIGPGEEELLRVMGLLGEWDVDDPRGVAKAMQKLFAVLRANHGL